MVVNTRAVALTIAGSDSGGGAGIAADVKTFEAHRVWATVAVTAVTVQNSQGVSAIVPMGPMTVRAQIEAVVSDFAVAAAKTGMLGSPDTVEAVAEAAADFGISPLVVDPVLRASTGEALSTGDLARSIRHLLLPRTAVVTPNLAEAGALAHGAVQTRRDMEAVARELVGLGAGAALVTGGHVAGDPSSPDCLVVQGRPDAVWLEAGRVPTGDSHGTGCVLSAAITANLAHGLDVEAACRAAKAFVTGAIAAACRLGQGAGAVDPGWQTPST